MRFHICASEVHIGNVCLHEPGGGAVEERRGEERGIEEVKSEGGRGGHVWKVTVQLQQSRRRDN